MTQTDLGKLRVNGDKCDVDPLLNCIDDNAPVPPMVDIPPNGIFVRYCDLIRRVDATSACNCCITFLASGKPPISLASANRSLSRLANSAVGLAGPRSLRETRLIRELKTYTYL